MKSAAIPDNESARLKALRDYQILDTEAEQAFDNLTQLASEICETPIALISLIDPDRQWFKSKVGLDATETTRDIAFCAHAILQDDVFEVCDTLDDDRFFDNPLVTNDPNIRFYAGSPLITPEGQAIGTLCTIDRKPKKLSEHQRKALKILCQQVISQLELRLKMRQLEKANARKTEFLTTVSHELRTPLNAVISFSQLMLDDAQDKQLPEHFSQYLKHIDYSGNRLLSLVNSVLDLTKIEEDRLDTLWVKLQRDEFFKSVFGMLSVAAEEKGVTFVANLDDSVPEVFVSDETKLVQIMTNLISNAIKFTAPGKAITVHVFTANDNLQIVVEDKGRGISETDQKKLFQKFERADNSRDVEGTGLGLVITKALVELLGGSITLSSRLDVGTIVKVKLPLRSLDDATGEAITPEDNRRFDTQANILVVEDDLINQQVAEAIFANLGLSITLAGCGEEALELAARQGFDMVFMDLQLPGMSGQQCAQALKNAYPALPIVALSADAFANREPHNNLGILDDFLTKPIEIHRLIGTLNTYLNQP